MLWTGQLEAHTYTAIENRRVDSVTERSLRGIIASNNLHNFTLTVFDNNYNLTLTIT